MTDFDRCEGYVVSHDDQDSIAGGDAAADPKGAIDAWLARAAAVGETPRQTVERRGGSVVVDGYDRASVTDEWLKDVAEGLAVQVAENFGEEYGGPDGTNDGDGFTEDVLAKLTAAIAGAIGPIVRDEGVVTEGVKVASHTFTADEVVDLLGEE